MRRSPTARTSATPGRATRTAAHRSPTSSARPAPSGAATPNRCARAASCARAQLRRRPLRSSAVLDLVPARRRQELEQRAPAVRVVVLELGVVLVELDLELPLL